MSNFSFRPYQVVPVQKGIEFFTEKKHQKASVLVLPTGAGKSFIIGGIAKGVQDIDSKSPILVLQPKVELLLQNVGKYESLVGFSSAVYCASANNRKEIDFVTYATLDSMINAVHQFVAAGFKNIIVDECDAGYRSDKGSMFDRVLTALESNGDKVRLLGLTATPFRLVNSLAGSRLLMLNKVKGAKFKEFLHITQISEIAEKYWCPIEYRVKQFDGSMLRINSTGNEFTDDSAELFEKNNFVNIYNACMDTQYKHTLCFMRSVKQCEKMAKLVPGSAVVSAKTPAKERAQIIANFKSGKIRVLINVGILSVGFDFPELDHIIPPTTNSLRLWYQIVGRIVRTHPDKSMAYVTDLCGMVAKFGRVETITIEKVGNEYHAFTNGKQVTGLELQASTYTPPAPNLDTMEFQDLIFDRGKFEGKKISECPDWYIRIVSETFTWLPKHKAQCTKYLQIKGLRIL